MAKPVMFLRTALTEQRITDLEEKMAMVLTKLGMVPASPSDEEWEAAAPEKVPRKQLDIPPFTDPKPKAKRRA